MTVSCQWNGTVPCWLPLSAERVVKCNWYCCSFFSLPFSLSRYLYRVLGGVKLTSCAQTVYCTMEVCVCIYGTRGALVESGAFQHSRFCVSEDVRLGASVQVCSHQTQHLKHLISQKWSFLQRFRVFTSLGVMILFALLGESLIGPITPAVERLE